jgi:N-acylneuraminate cytidylyltransferase
MMPIRSGSKGVSGKNIREFRGKPLFYWNLKALLDSEMFDAVYVSSDSWDYIHMVDAEFYNRIIGVYRPERLARDDATTIRVVQEFIEGADLEDSDYFALTQATSPYLTVDDIKESFRMMDPPVKRLNEMCDSVMTAGRMKRFLWTDDGEGLNVPKDGHKRRQDWRGTLVQNGCFYLTTAGMIRDTGMLWGGRLGFIEQPYWFDIDEEADFVYGEEVMRAQRPA